MCRICLLYTSAFFEAVCELPERFGDNRIEDDVRPGDRLTGAKHTKLEFIAGKRERGKMCIRDRRYSTAV